MTTPASVVGDRLDTLAKLGFYTRLFEIAKDHHATLEEVLVPGKQRRVINARFACWSYLRGLTRNDKPVLSSTDIGDLFGVDHTTVLNGVAKHRARTKKEAA